MVVCLSYMSSVCGCDVEALLRKSVSAKRLPAIWFTLRRATVLEPRDPSTINV